MPNLTGKGKGFQGRSCSRGKVGHASKECKGKGNGGGAYSLQDEGYGNEQGGRASWADYGEAWGDGFSDTSNNFTTSVLPHNAWMMCLGTSKHVLSVQRARIVAPAPPNGRVDNKYSPLTSNDDGEDSDDSGRPSLVDTSSSDDECSSTSSR